MHNLINELTTLKTAANSHRKVATRVDFKISHLLRYANAPKNARKNEEKCVYHSNKLKFFLP